MSIDLTFTSKAVNSLEKRHNMSVANLIGRDSIAILASFICAGNHGMKEDDAFDIIDKYRAEEKSTTKLQLEIIETLEDQGFLDKDLGMSRKIRNHMQKLASTDSLDAIGQPSSLQQ